MERSQAAPEQGPGPTPQPSNPTPVVPQNNNSLSISARLKANLPYFKTIIGILKILSLVFGLVALGLIFYGYQNASLFDSIRDSDGYSSSSVCHRSNVTYCGLNTYFKDRLCIKERRKVTVCVNTLLITCPLALVGITWNCTLITLVVLLVGKQSRTKRYFRRDTFCQMLAAGLVIVSSFCLIGYFIQVRQEDLCGKENLKGEATDYVFNGPSNNSKPSTEDDSKKIQGILANLTKQCPEMHIKRYYPWRFLFAGIFALITGIIYIVIGALSKKESSRAVDVEPVRMVMGPNGPQQWPPSQAQMQVASRPNPESDASEQSPPVQA